MKEHSVVHVYLTLTYVAGSRRRTTCSAASAHLQYPKGRARRGQLDFDTVRVLTELLWNGDPENGSKQRDPARRRKGPWLLDTDRGTRYCAVLEELTNAFACTLAEVRQEVLEQCYLELYLR